MQPAELKTFFRTQIEAVKDDYLKDLDAMSHEQLSAKLADTARSAYDFTYEVAFVNRRIAKRLRGETPEPFNAEGFITCPPDYDSKDKAKADLESSMKEVLAAWDSVPETDLNREIVMPSGNKTSPVDLAFMCAYHTGYHDAQLNYLQSIHGDREMHWG